MRGEVSFGACVQLFVLAATLAASAKATPIRGIGTPSPNASDASAPETVPECVNHTHSYLFNGLFEGDLKLTDEEIRWHYRIADDVRSQSEAEKDEDDPTARNGTRSRNVRAVTNLGNLWPNAVIRYECAPNVPRYVVDIILNAMKEWEDETCLRFLPKRSSDSDYVYFTTENTCGRDLDVCCSESVGRKGGKQTISLPGLQCNNKGVIMHLIGHVIGFWHEESRPDRDNYISINYNNIQTGAHDQFLKRNDLDVDYQGVGYDYGSIMHLPLTVFANCEHPASCPTMRVSNNEEHAKQGYPPVGLVTHVSERDAKQANYLYNCPGRGIPGRLTISVYSGTNFNYYAHPYVKVTAVDNNGMEFTMSTDVKHYTTTPIWSQDLQFQGRHEWQFFRIRVYDEDPGNDDALSMSETVVITRATNTVKDHCLSTGCTGYVRYRYQFVLDGDECNPNPCRNGGVCTDLIADYNCQCDFPWDPATDCSTRKQWKLTVFVRYARYIGDGDTHDGAGISDPYVEVYARDYFGRGVTVQTDHVPNDIYPIWNQKLNLGTGHWRYFRIRVMDYDFGSSYDDALSRWEYVYVSPGSHEWKYHYGYRGFIRYDYHLTEP